MRNETDVDPGAETPLRPIERDVLLASSDELPWHRRFFFRRRLARDAEARRLAETLCLIELTVNDAPVAPAPIARRRLAWAAAAVAACALIAAIGWAIGRPATNEAPVVVHLDSAVEPAPLFESARQLVLLGARTSTPADTLVFDVLGGYEASVNPSVRPAWSSPALTDRLEWIFYPRRP